MQRHFSRNGKKKDKGRDPTDARAVVKDETPSLLPMLVDQLLTGFVLRFMTTANWSGSYTVTYANLLDAWFLAGTATTAYQLFDFVKIRKVTVRAMGTGIYPSYTVMPSATVGIEFPGLVGGQFGSGKQRIGTGAGTTVPAFVSLKPDPMSQAAQFQPSTANPAFVVRARDALGVAIQGAIIDVAVTYKNSADINPAAVTTARAGLTAGLIYFGGIDGLATANTQARSAFVPQA